MKLSVITVNYNNKAGLQRTIDSVVCQTWRDFEWIVIDGGSTDGSKEFLEQYQQHFAYWCSEPDGGVYNAMNKGIARAKGDYLLFLNSGDCFHNETVLRDFDGLNCHEDVVAGISVSLDSGETVKILYSDIVRQLFFDSLNHQATFIKRHLFATHKYNERNKIVSDWEFFIQTILIDGCSFRYIDLIVADFDTTGISSQPELADVQKQERMRVLDSSFSTYVRKDLIHYLEICSTPYYQNVKYLQEHSRFLSILIRKLNSLFYKLFVMNHIGEGKVKEVYRKHE